jgi:hypothetical protein
VGPDAAEMHKNPYQHSAIAATSNRLPITAHLSSVGREQAVAPTMGDLFGAPLHTVAAMLGHMALKGIKHQKKGRRVVRYYTSLKQVRSWVLV